MADVKWTPLGNARAGMIAVAAAGTFSILCIVLVGTYIGWLLWDYSRKSGAQKLEGETRAIKFLTSSHGILFVQLLFADLLQAIGFLINYAWVARNAFPPQTHPTGLCTAQALLIEIGDMGSAFSSLLICINLFVVLVPQKHIPMRVVAAGMVGQWVIVGLLASVGSALVRDGVPFYGAAGGWCWMSTIYQSERLWLHYLWVFLVAGAELGLYAIIAYKLRFRSRSSQLPGASDMSMKMMAFPATYIITVIPLSVIRCGAMAGKEWAVEAQLAAGTIFTLAGTADCIIYTKTRRLFSTHAHSSDRRGSGTTSSGPKSGTSSMFKRRPHGLRSVNHHISGIQVNIDVDVHLPGFSDDALTMPPLPEKPRQGQRHAHWVDQPAVGIGARPFQTMTKVVGEEDESNKMEHKAELEYYELREREGDSYA
ncbi:hypothetical protein JCM21900_005198 [Sporobolomyces salmonicolor]